MSDEQTLERPPLGSLNGKPAPTGLARDIRAISQLPDKAVEQLWQVLMPSLREPLPPIMEQHLDVFCERHELDASQLARVIKACRFLLREAAVPDLSPFAFSQDVALLSGGDERTQVLLLARYELAKAFICEEIRPLLDHGRLATGVDWRLNHIAASNRGHGGPEMTAQLTFQCRDGHKTERITMQMLPGTLRELRGICDKLLQ